MQIKIKKRNCYNCNKNLDTKSCWYFFNDNVFCSKSCRQKIISSYFSVRKINYTNV